MRSNGLVAITVVFMLLQTMNLNSSNALVMDYHRASLGCFYRGFHQVTLKRRSVVALSGFRSWASSDGDAKRWKESDGKEKLKSTTGSSTTVARDVGSGSSRRRNGSLSTSTSPSRWNDLQRNKPKQPPTNLQQRSTNNRPPRMTRSTEDVEDQLTRALESLKLAVFASKSCRSRESNSRSHISNSSVPTGGVALDLLLFPTTRECNAALAAFGDAHDLLRALQLFGKMRKATSLQQSLAQQKIDIPASFASSATSTFATMWPPVPTPTLVTYSTLMSRFLKANKPAVALRLWNLMIHQNMPNQPIDVRAANILMNCYAKLANVEAGRALLQDMKDEVEAKPVGVSATTMPFHVSTLKRSPHVAMMLPRPNSITYNTFLSACHKSGDLDSALAALDEMKHGVGLAPDIQAYTTLIATVARRPSRAAGLYDPSLAFAFLTEMAERGIQPNGMTYSALIDVCGRCRRSDLALQSLRIMLQQKAQEEKDATATIKDQTHNAVGKNNPESGKNYTLPGEVGAWTAAITACGKAGRLETAVRLFYGMETKFGVQPNTITCGSLTDSLLKAGRTAETLDVLRYMKRVGIRPSEVMYTSLMSRAEKLVEMERQADTQWSVHPDDQPLHPADFQSTAADGTDETEAGGATTKAIEVYTELIDSLINFGSSTSQPMGPQNRHDKVIRERTASDSKSTALLRAFLVFQQMKAADVQVDVLCYNTLLRACAQAGDFARAQDVIYRMQRDDLDPNDTSWRLLLRSVLSSSQGKHGNQEGHGHIDVLQLSESIWNQALAFGNSRRRVDDPIMRRWIPSVDSLTTLLSVYMRQAEIEESNKPRQQECYRRLLSLYDGILMGQTDMGMNRIDVNRCLESQRAMLVILQGLVSLEASLQEVGIESIEDTARDERAKLRAMAASIVKLDCFSDHQGTNVPMSQPKLGFAVRDALRTARRWASLTHSKP